MLADRAQAKGHQRLHLPVRDANGNVWSPRIHCCRAPGVPKRGVKLAILVAVGKLGRRRCTTEFIIVGDIDQLKFVQAHSAELRGPFLEVGSHDYGSTQDLRALFLDD